MGLYDEIKPQLIITEEFPFGRSQLIDEATTLVKAAKRGGAVVAGLKVFLEDYDEHSLEFWRKTEFLIKSPEGWHQRYMDLKEN